jgi:hypothetical protein
LNGRAPTIPSDLTFNVLETLAHYRVKENYVEAIIERLRAAFKLARRQQYTAAVENEDRGGIKHKPDFKPGDMLFVWARNSEESRFERSDGKTVALPKKWINPWIGPFRMIKWTSERKCLLDCAGKYQEFIVNRLSKHNRWDEINPSTYTWALKDRQAKEDAITIEKAAVIETRVELFDKNYVFHEGEIIVFEQQISELYPIPFGLGIVLEHTRGELVKFQWLGNIKNNEKGKWERCWFQQNEAKIYYANNPLHKKHAANTGADTDTRIRPGDVIMSSRGDIEILSQDKTKGATFSRITSAARKIIESNPYVREEREKIEAAEARNKAKEKKRTRISETSNNKDLDSKYGI